ncbi:MAG: ABC transporter permease [Proteobacteria bacterium]|nr:ABC transporter permease [Pseudomonadota bacterium]
MFTLIESFRSAIESIIAHGFRSVLTTLGIIIGVASVIAVISLVQGLRVSIMSEFASLGTNSFSVSSYTPLEERLKGRNARLAPQDLQLIQERVEGIESITPILFSEDGAGLVRYQSQTTLTQVRGTTYSFQDVAGIYAAEGRFLSATDSQKRRRVCVLGQDTAKDLSLPEDPIGEYIEIGGEWLKVIGVMEPRGEMFGFSQDDFVMVPYETMRSMNGVQDKPDIVIQMTVADIDDLEEITDRIRSLLRRTHGLTGNQPDDFRVETSEQMAESFEHGDGDRERHRRYFTAGRWNRNNEHHAGLGYRTYPRDRYLQSARGTT